jgi:1-acyl-sn-glycerol-3-phosphate acyltransferase
VRSVLHEIAGLGIIGAARIVTGVTARWTGCGPSGEQRIYFANHRSHGDFVLIWSVLPPHYRMATRPVAGSDYWAATAARRFIGDGVFNAVLIDRSGAGKDQATRPDPLVPVRTALEEGYSLILFPEGTRNTTDAPLLPFKSGLYYLAEAFPHVPLVPTWIANIGRVMPKGEILPIPLLCSVTFGAPLALEAGETKGTFLERTQKSLLDLAPEADGARQSGGTA